jgi:hypothetical protein
MVVPRRAERITDPYRGKPALSIDAPLIGAEQLTCCSKICSRRRMQDLTRRTRRVRSTSSMQRQTTRRRTADVFMAHQLEDAASKLARKRA